MTGRLVARTLIPGTYVTYHCVIGAVQPIALKIAALVMWSLSQYWAFTIVKVAYGYLL